MPYRIQNRDCEQADGTSGEWVVEKDEGTEDDPDWTQVSCHLSESAARAARRIREEAEVATTAKATTVKATDEEIDERYDAFQETVNMTASELRTWADSECSDLASENPGDVRGRVLSLLDTNKSEWGDDEFEAAGRVISFVSRMQGVEQGDPANDDCPSERDIALMNWGFDPTKSVKVAPSDLDEGDLVTWQDGDAFGRVDTIETSGTVSSSLGDQEMEGTEETPAILIELVDEDGNGRDETVVHRAETLTVVDEVKSPKQFKSLYPAPTTGPYVQVASEPTTSKRAPHPMPRNAEDPLVSFSGGLHVLGSGKMYGKDKGVRVGGYGIVFTDPDDLDLDGQFFTRETDLWLPGDREGSVWPIYGHGMDPVLKSKRFSDEPWTMVKEDAGAWIEGQIQIADKYDEMLVEKGIKPGKMGLSTGAVSHLVRTEKAEKGEWIKEWPTYENSITPQPAEWKTKPGLNVINSKAFTRLHRLSSLRMPTLKSVCGVDPSVQYKSYRPTSRIRPDSTMQKRMRRVRTAIKKATKGEALADAIEAAIGDVTDENEDMSRADVIEMLADNSAGDTDNDQIEEGTVNQITDASIICPPLFRLRGFEDALDLEEGTLVGAAESDGCMYENKEASMDDKLSAIRRLFKDEFQGGPDEFVYVIEVFDNRLIAEVNGDFFEVGYSGRPMDGSLSFESESEWTQVVEQSEWVAVDEVKSDDLGEVVEALSKEVESLLDSDPEAANELDQAFDDMADLMSDPLA
jgi:hypothetical protein